MFRTPTQTKHGFYGVSGLVATSGLVVAALTLIALAGQVDPQATGEPAEGSVETADASIARGKYLVHQVAMCVQCHSPRSAGGDLLERAVLQGGRIPVTSPYRDLPWALMAPRLAGIPGWDHDDLALLLQTGARRDGSSPRPPMPPFRMNQEDAQAVVAYLSSLSL
jgi:mono/diheme cytochrome c family protein